MHEIPSSFFYNIFFLSQFLMNSNYFDVIWFQWLNHGRDITNRRYADDEVLISPKTVSRMKLKWKFFAGKDISATPAVDNGVVYFPSWNGYLYAVNAINGGLIWKQNLSALTGLNGTGIVVNVTVSRSTPTVVYGLLIIGIYGPAVVIAMDRSNGKLVWSTQLDPRPRVLITMSGTAYQGLVNQSNLISNNITFFMDCYKVGLGCWFFFFLSSRS
jgi:outer membrane protein assembly factor BamB